MTSLIIRNIIRFIIFLFLQVLLFNNIHVFSYITPFIYIFPFLLLPVNTPRWLLLLVGFSLGLILDFFSNTGGIHAAATTIIAFSRPWIQNMIISYQEIEPGMQPGIKSFGLKWFFLYSLILTALHHIAYYFLEIFSFYRFFYTLGYAFINTFFTVVFIFIFQYLFYRND